MDSIERMSLTAVESATRDWKKVGGDLREAAIETARELGGEEFSREVELLAASGEGPLPDAAAFARLEEAFPGGAGRALDRSLEIASARRSRELAEATRQSSRSGFRQGVRDLFSRSDSLLFSRDGAQSRQGA
jgi:hypothetical protein